MNWEQPMALYRQNKDQIRYRNLEETAVWEK